MAFAQTLAHLLQPVLSCLKELIYKPDTKPNFILPTPETFLCHRVPRRLAALYPDLFGLLSQSSAERRISLLFLIS